MKQATHFIEVYKNINSGKYYHSNIPLNIIHLSSSLISTVDIGYCETIAIFKIYPKVKPMLAHYDNDLNAIIIE